MTSFKVQFILPEDNPVNKVRMGRWKGDLFFEVPINYPDAHNLTLPDLLLAAERSGLLILSTDLNKKNNSGRTLNSKVKEQVERMSKNLDPGLDRHVKR